MPWARFDDLVAGTAQVYEAVGEPLVASCADEVPPLLTAVEEACRSGRWAFGYVGYEAAPAFDAALAVDPGPSVGAVPSVGAAPLAWFALSEAPRAVPVVEPPALDEDVQLGWTIDWSAEAYRDAFAAVRSAIEAGDTFQCNLTTVFRAQGPVVASRLYARLVTAQRGRYGAYLDLGRHVIASASPELFFDWDGEVVRTAPMKGTATRGRTPLEDAERRRALTASAKERAENVMIVDLLRNDVGRVAETGSVRVGDLLKAERYDTLWQLTSEVSARARPEVGLLDLFAALFPCGSVTGAPKASTMSLIRQVEGRRRGVYCGAIGVVGPASGGDVASAGGPSGRPQARFSVAIRTVQGDRATGTWEYGAGSAVTVDSDADAEYAEIMAKAAILSHAVSDFDLIETLRFEAATGLRNIDRHLQRLASSASYFGFEFCRDEVLRAAEAALVAGGPAGGDIRVRITLSRNGKVAVQLATAPAAEAGPVRLRIDSEPVDPSSVWLFHKTTRRAEYERRFARRTDADDVLLLNSDGFVTESTVANLAARFGDRWITPPVADGCLPGVERGRLLESGRLCEGSVTPELLVSADELAVLNSLRGWRSAVLLPTEPAQP